jgi:hypothetical protein
MPQLRRKSKVVAPSEALPSVKRKPIPHEFVLEALAPLSPHTRIMFGCLAIYVGEKIVLCLRDKPTATDDNGVWLATTAAHHESLRRELPSLRSIGVLGKDVTNWQILPAESPHFEQEAMHACDLILARDPRIGKVPKPRSSKSGTRKNSLKKRLPAK